MAKNTLSDIQFFQQVLLTWFNTEGRSFPWRNPGLSPYELTVTETLLQRTKAETISRFYNIFFNSFPNWEAIANCNINELEDALRPIGLYTQRARRLKNLSMEMVKRKGIFPITRTELETIPFVGQYIANAIQLLIFELPTPLIDVNMARVLERFFEKRKMADIRHDKNLQELAYNVVNIKNSKTLNWAILDFAALICKARNPMCLKCPLNIKCSFFKAKVLDLAQDGI